MGSIGGIEKVMVFGILVIILTILSIAIYSATKVDDDLTANQMKAAGENPVVALLDSDDPLDKPKTAGPNRYQGTPFKDVLPQQQTTDAPNEVLKSNTTAGNLNTTGNLETAGNIDTSDKRNPNRARKQSGNGRANQNKQQNQRPGQRIFQETERDGDNAEVVMGPRSDERNNPVMKEYTVKAGDSFSGIARALYGDARYYTLLMKANPDVDPMNLQINQKIKVPPLPNETSQAGVAKESSERSAPEDSDGLYTVQTGDTLIKISQTFYGTSKKWKQIYDANREVIHDPDMLQVGARLQIP